MEYDKSIHNMYSPIIIYMYVCVHVLVCASACMCVCLCLLSFEMEDGSRKGVDICQYICLSVCLSVPCLSVYGP